MRWESTQPVQSVLSYSDLTVNTHNIVMTVTDEMGETARAIDYTVGTPPNSLTVPLMVRSTRRTAH